MISIADFKDTPISFGEELNLIYHPPSRGTPVSTGEDVM